MTAGAAIGTAGGNNPQRVATPPLPPRGRGGRGVRALATLALLLAACGSAKPAPPPRPTATPTIAASAVTGTRTIIDMAGRSVSVADTVDRVVAISPSALDFANALGLTVVGRPSDTTGSSAPAVGSTLSPDFTAIAALHPDLVIADAAYDGSRLRDFDSFPYPVFVLRAGSYAEVLATLTALGAATAHATQATAAAASIEARVDAVVAKAAASAPKPTVLIVTGAGRDVYGGSDSSYTGALTKLLGANNLLGTLPVGAPIAGFGTVDLGQLATRNPDVVLAIPAANGTLAADIRSSPAWANTNAVKRNKVFELDSPTYLRSPGPHVADAVEHLYQILYQ
jgi:ABC-type Fe3+-hydroxamate transport system substrate-binding protein